MHHGVAKIMLGLVLIVGGILVIKALENDLGYLVFLAGLIAAAWGGIGISASGMREVGN